jgi:hypothetical protein
MQARTGKRPMYVMAAYESPVGEGNLQFDAVNALLKREWDAGALVGVIAYPRNPATGRGFGGRDLVVWDSLFDTGTATGRAWAAYVDQYAQGLKVLRAMGVSTFVVQPFAEMNTPAFWWGSRTREQFVRLWRWLHDRLRVQHGLTDLIWVLNPLDTDKDSPTYYHPGSQYVDVVGLNVYPPSADYVLQRTRDAWAAVLAMGAVPVWAEFGIPDTRLSYAPLPASLEQHCPQAAWVLAWDEYWAWTSHPGVDTVVASPRMLTR